MLNLLLPVLAAVAPQEAWTALTLPELCEESNPSPHLPALDCGGHIHLDEPNDAFRRNSRALLTASDVSELLERSSAAVGKRISFFPYSPPLLARGSAADVAWAAGALAALDAAGKRNRMTISAWLIPSRAASVPGEGDEWPDARSWQAVTQPGEELVFGQRHYENFIAGYDVDVSTDSGVGAPRIGGVHTGKTVHLSASRVEGGARYHLHGLLDLAELVALEVFDPDTPELGELVQPRVNSVTLAFSGVADSGQLLRVEIEGAPLAQADWTLFVRVDTAAEPEGPAAAEDEPGHDWRAIDVTLLSKRARSLPLFAPGAGLDGQAVLEALAPQTATITSSGVLSAVELDRRGRRSGTARPDLAEEPATQVCEGLLLVSAQKTPNGLAQRVAEFVRSVEAPRLLTTTVELQSGGFRARFPVAAGAAARLSVGQERTLLTGYRAEIAPNTWMPSPTVEHSFDGLAWQGRSNGHQISTSAWISSTETILVRDRYQAQLGAVQLPKRSLRGARKAHQIDAGEVEILSDIEGSTGIRMQLHSL